MPDTMDTERFSALAAATAWGNLEGARSLIELGDLEGARRAIENAEAWVDAVDVEASDDLATAIRAMRSLLGAGRTWHERILTDGIEI
jgi:hypothetical protein